jgi:hypothetical protein
MEELTKDERRKIFSPEFYKEEMKWFPDIKCRLSNVEAEEFFRYEMGRRGIEGWGIVFMIGRADGIGLCRDVDIVVGEDPLLVNLVHEMGHILTEDDHGEGHKRVMLELYGDYVVFREQ